MPRPVLLWTDAVLWLLVAALALYGWRLQRDPARRAPWRRILHDAPALCALIVFGAFALVALLDSLHFRRALPPTASGEVFYATRTESLLDVLLARPIAMRESSYSAPLATHAFNRQSVEQGGSVVRTFPRLQHGGAHLADPGRDRAGDVTRRVLAGVAGALVVATMVLALMCRRRRRQKGIPWRWALEDIVHDRTRAPLRAALLCVTALCLVAGPVLALMGHYHVLGTDRTGNDVLVQALKSVRTAFVIGSLATVATLPLALVLGIVAGYLRGWADALIQYLYTVLSAVPNVLLIAACVLMVQVFIDQNPGLFATGAERSDLRLLLLCLILGLTGWATLCRLLRAETLKLREMEYVQAATAFGLPAGRIMLRHILPNTLHLVLITTVLDFSALVLYEAVLSYVGVGVDPSLNSFGGMINLARSEMSRDPLVWWSFTSAFMFMLALVLSANLLADGVRDAFDPRARALRVQRG
ncbi:ABC transporter permease [Azohydromonas caseinilytica]|uniref:ABC transporter permease n=1 Tax=Azohydromonas caseinilytica TaxID=2728836 RepID=A0A848FAX1_9BURK|nr:ABC transporter permease [Azohydromonas caseinilytica]NML15473.1 ABC transporter permease [Azohydromonas caseinilytica]